jgi:hypothetical protein
MNEAGLKITKGVYLILDEWDTLTDTQKQTTSNYVKQMLSEVLK